MLQQRRTDLKASVGSDRLWARYQNLGPSDKMIVRLKALTGETEGRDPFMSALHEAGGRTPKGTPWTLTSLNIALLQLYRDGLLDARRLCVAPLEHLVAVDATEGPDGPRLLAAITAIYPRCREKPTYFYDIEEDTNFIRDFRLAIYQNNEEEFKSLMEVLRGSAEKFITDLCSAMPLSPGWLAKRAPTIRTSLLLGRLAAFLKTGATAPDGREILMYHEAHIDDPGAAFLDVGLLPFDLLGGRMASARARLARVPETHEIIRPAFQGSIAFLEGDNDQSIELHAKTVKLIRQRMGRRKAYPSDCHGLFHLLALLRTGDDAHHATVQSALDAVHGSSMHGAGFEAVQALLWLSQGAEAKARESLAKLRRSMPDEPLSAALVVLAEYILDVEIARAHRNDTITRFDRLRDTLPTVARIYAEVLDKVAVLSAPYDKFLDQTEKCGIKLRLVDIIQIRKPWERALDNLARFLQGAEPASQAAPAKAKRLAWLLAPNQKLVSVVEQIARGRDGWTGGRPVALKRLFENDRRLDYLTEHDRRALRGIKHTSRGWEGDLYEFDTRKTIAALVGHPCVFDARQPDRRLELVAYPAELVVKEQKSGYQLKLSHKAKEPTIFLEEETPTRYRVIDFSETLVELQGVMGDTGLAVPRQARDRVTDLLKQHNPALPIRADVDLVDLPALAGETTPVLQLQPRGEGLLVTLRVRPFGGKGPLYVPGHGGASVLALIDGQHQRVNRDEEAERAAAARLIAALPSLEALGAEGFEWTTGDLETSLELLLDLRSSTAPVRVEWPEGEKLKVAPAADASKLSVKLAQSRNWFQLSGEVRVDENLVLGMSELLARLSRRQGRFIQLDDGRFLALTREFQSQLERLRAVSEDDKDGRRLHPLSALAVQDLIDDAGTLRADKHWKAFAERVRAAGDYSPAVPSTLQAELRDYQIEGFAWLSRLARWGAGACLADDMGLGKTVQAIAAMIEPSQQGACLVVAPTSVCHNWQGELERFAPTLRAHRFAAAADRGALIAGLGAGDVLIVSYGLLHQEAERLAAVTWQVVIFDEAQALKNADTKRAQASQKLQAGFRLALTGTPVENYLDELWSLFNTINPGLLGSHESFQRRFATPIERDRDSLARQALRTLIRPFILRRTKSAVLTELPPRTELTLDVELPPEERAFYEALRRKALDTLAELGGAKGQHKIHILAEITRLRRACCHPGLIDATTTMAGAKLGAFLELVDDLIRNRHRALVFSQFVGHLERVRAALDARGVAYQYLDGSTPARQREERVQAFQAGKGDLFLISLKAGGTGLNLTAADFVIHLDPWWNPAVEDQASDRAHRIGQKRPVTIYRLIVQDSIEEQILALHRDKRDLANDLLAGSEMSARLSEEELIDLIRR
jgi:superfamily II DNA or RNA helicase